MSAKHGKAAAAGGLGIRTVILAAAAVAANAAAAPYVPDDPAEVILELAPRTGPEWDEIRRLHARLDAGAGGASVAARLANEYLQLFRMTGDPRLMGYAGAVLSPWEQEDDAPRAVALQLAALAGLDHRFDDALKVLDTLLERDPREAQAWLMRAANTLVVGRYEESRSACARLVLLTDAVSAGACLAAVDAVTGRAERALAFLESSLERGTGSAALEGWLRLLAAETAAGLDEPDRADAHFRAALAAAHAADAKPTVYLITAYADFLLDAGRFADALSLLADAPRSEGTLLRTAAAKRALSLPAEEDLQTLAHGLQLALSGSAPAHAREAAYFLARLQDRPRDALTLALANWSRQRELLDARLVLESAAALCDPSAAAPVMEWMETNAVEHAALTRQRETLLGECV